MEEGDTDDPPGWGRTDSPGLPHEEVRFTGGGASWLLSAPNSGGSSVKVATAGRRRRLRHLDYAIPSCHQAGPWRLQRSPVGSEASHFREDSR